MYIENWTDFYSLTLLSLQNGKKEIKLVVVYHVIMGGNEQGNSNDNQLGLNAFMLEPTQGMNLKLRF